MNKSTPKQLNSGDHGAKLAKKPKKEKSVVKKFTTDEIRDMVKSGLHLNCDPAEILKTAAEKVNAYLVASDKKAEEIKKDMFDSHREVLNSLGLETHYAIAETVGKRHQPLVIEVARQVEKEYDCKTASEKILVQIVAGTYGKIIEYSSLMNNNIVNLGIGGDKNNYLAMLSKELDRAHRQLITALVTLRQIKNPPVELNVKAKTAFVAQNQQINAVNNPAQEHENIEPK